MRKRGKTHASKENLSGNGMTWTDEKKENIEKRCEKLSGALDFLDEDLLEEVNRLRITQDDVGIAEDIRMSMDTPEAGMQKKVAGADGQSAKTRKLPSGRGFRWVRMSGLAASICLLLLGSYSMTRLVLPEFSNNGDMNGAAPEQSENMSGQGRPETAGEADGTEAEDEANKPEDGLPEDKNEGMEYGKALGDKFWLHHNYSRVYAMSNEEWMMAEGEAEALVNAVEITDAQAIDGFVDALCSGIAREADSDLETETEEVRHLFFEKKDGEIVHVLLLGDGHVAYQELPMVYVEVEDAVYDSVMDVIDGLERRD